MKPPSLTPGLLPSGRKPKFYPSDVLVMAILRDDGWTVTRIAREFGTVRSVVARYLHHRFTPGRWAA
jgi:hypothetical protein